MSKILYASCILLSGVSAHHVMAAEDGESPALFIDPQPKVQTLQSVLNWTYLNNPVLQAARAELRSVQEQLPLAYSSWLPNVNASAGITKTNIESEPSGGIFGSTTGSTEKNLGVSLDQSIYRGGRTFSEVKAARYVIGAQTARVIQTEQAQLSAAAESYMNVFRDRSVLELAQNNSDVIARQLEATRERFEVGELTKTDVSQAEARLANAQAQIITAKGDLRASEATFEQIIGFKPEKLEYPYSDFALPENLDDAIEKARLNNPSVLSAKNAHRAAEEDIDSVFGELLPEIGLSGAVQRAYDPSPGNLTEQTSKSIGISASMPLYEGGAVRSRVRSAKHTANQRFIEITSQERDIKQSVIQAWETLKTAEAEITAREAQIKASSIAQEGVRAEAEFGSRTVLDTLDADQEFLDANVALVTARRNKVVAEYTLLATLGDLRPDRLGFEADTRNYQKDLDKTKTNFFNMDVDRLGQ